MSNSQPFLHLLRQAGYRITPQRRAICEYLATTEQHPTAYGVYEALAAHHPELSRATVYNTLNVLHELGALVQLDLGDEHTHYETNLAPHVNLICRRCRTVFDFTPTEPPTAFLDLLRVTSGFQPATVHVQVMGICPACQAKEHA
jgi:Fur family transcriptional regulator, peroxide stress response regulator